MGKKKTFQDLAENILKKLHNDFYVTSRKSVLKKLEVIEKRK